MPLTISPAKPEQFKEIAAFTSGFDPLSGHEPHFFKIILEYFGDTALVAVDDTGKVCGWTFGLASQREEGLFFLWQIGVAKGHMRNGIGSALLKGLMGCAKEKSCTRMRATVEVHNIASKSLFEKAGFKNVSASFKEAVLTNPDSPHVFDHYGENDEMIVYEKEIG